MRPRVVVVAHRETMVAEGIAAALGRFPAIVPGPAVTTANDAERYGAAADAVALDWELPGAERAAGRLRRKGVRVVLLGECLADDDESGVTVPTRAPVATLAAALVPEAGGRPQLSYQLTTRERQILALAARGLAAKQMARHMGISEKTVERHKTKMFAKLGVVNQTAAVGFALAGGLAGELTWNQLST